MASPPRRICASGNGCENAAITSCEGCLQAFCTKHFTKHRDELNDQISGMINEHDDLKNSLGSQIKNPDSFEIIIKRVSEWEKESIVKIKDRSKEIRLKLLKLAESHKEGFSQKFQSLSEQMKEYRADGDFLEVDIRRWRQTLDDFKLNLISPSTVTIVEDDGTPLVQNISVNLMKKTTNELFELVFDNEVRIEENGQLAIRGASGEFTEIRGKNKYITGCHKIRLRIEGVLSSWIFLGINSKSIPLQRQSCYSVSSYGWSCNNYCWSNGQPEEDSSNNRIEMANGDEISLVFDCDNCVITMMNERTQAKHELAVIVDNCPFPWQLHVVLNEAHNHVRILSD